jgi:predicted small metal-binding protein
LISDWWAFSHKSGNLYEIFDWYKDHTKKMILHKNTKKLVEDILDKIKAELDKEVV